MSRRLNLVRTERSAEVISGPRFKHDYQIFFPWLWWIESSQCFWETAVDHNEHSLSVAELRLQSWSILQMIRLTCSRVSWDRLSSTVGGSRVRLRPRDIRRWFCSFIPTRPYSRTLRNDTWSGVLKKTLLCWGDMKLFTSEPLINA